MIRHWRYSIVFTFIVTSIFAGGGGGGAPGNNTCSGATSLTVSSSCSYTNSSNASATDSGESPTPTCASYSGGDVWFSFTVPASGSVNIDTQTGVVTDSGMALYTGSCGSLVQVDCDDDDSPNGAMSYISATGLTPGTTCYIRVWEYGGDNNGTFGICVVEPPPPAPCVGDMSIGSTTYSGNNLTTCGFGDDYSDADACGSFYLNGDDIVIEYTPTSNDCVKLALTNTNTWVGAFIMDGCPDDPSTSCLASATSSSGNPTINSFSVTSGTTYYIIVSTNPSPQCTNFDLDITVCPPPPANDECGGAIALTVNPDDNCGTTTSGTIENATTSGQTNDCFGAADDDVWYSFVATSSTHMIDLLNVSGSATDMYHSVYGGTCGSIGSAIECSDANNSVVSGLTPGNTYYVRIYTYTSTAAQNTTFSVCVGTPPPPPPNDECNNAEVLGVNPDYSCAVSGSGTISGATESSQSNGCSGTADDDVWFSFVATNTTHVVDLYNTVGSTTDLYHSVYSGSCGSLGAALVCSDPNHSNVTGLTPGNTYYVRVFTYTSTPLQTTNFDICIGTPPPPPANDDCPGAYTVNINSDGSCTDITNGTVGSATSSGQSLGGCFGTADDDVWFSFTATDPNLNINILNVVGSTTDLYHVLYDGSCGSLGTEIDCSDPNSSAQTGLTVGQTYLMRVYSYTSTAGQTTTFDVCVSVAPPPPTNVNCAQMEPICSGQPIAFTAQSNGTFAEAGNDYACLGDEPNPSWYYLEIAQSGDIAIDITASSDIDFALWGSYNSLAQAQGDCGSLPAPDDCSYSTSATELADISNVLAGEVYVLLVTNYADVTQTIYLNEAAGMTAQTNCAIVVLPADLLAINADRLNDYVLFDWTTASESNCAYFEVQKSKDGRLWQSFGFKDGQGNSETPHSYQVVDKHPFLGTSYYRYKQIDFDGNINYSPVQVVKENSASLGLFPQPAQNELSLKKDDFKVLGAVINDVSGKTNQISFHALGDLWKFDVSALTNGSYILHLTTDKGPKVARFTVLK